MKALETHTHTHTHGTTTVTLAPRVNNIPTVAFCSKLSLFLRRSLVNLGEIVRVGVCRVPCDTPHTYSVLL